MKSKELLKSNDSLPPKILLLHEKIPPQIQDAMRLARLAEMGRMSASVAHEINNPLMIAQGFAENIEMMLGQPNVSSQDLRLQVMEIIKACQRMSRIVTKMNRMSPDQKLRLHVLDLAEVALNAVDFVKVQVAAVDVQLEFDFTHPIPIECDALQIEQIVLNILTNAIRALEQKPGDRRLRISFEEIGREWQQIKIWNNGPAIDAETKAQIMEGQNMGHGLSISKAIMEVHGGDLGFYSDNALGTEFVLSFPRPKHDPWMRRERSESGVIFILDSQANYRRTLQEKFNLLGFQVESFAASADGLRRLSEVPSVGGVLIDLVPGQPEGEAVLRALRQRLGPAGLIFTMSHFPSAMDHKNDLKAMGATECFEKPLHADNFALILKLLDASFLAA